MIVNTYKIFLECVSLQRGSNEVMTKYVQDVRMRLSAVKTLCCNLMTHSTAFDQACCPDNKPGQRSLAIDRDRGCSLHCSFISSARASKNDGCSVKNEEG